MCNSHPPVDLRHRAGLATVSSTYRWCLWTYLDEPGELVADQAVAVAGSGAQRVAVEDGDAAAAVADQPGALQHGGVERDGGAADTQHLGEELLGEEELVSTDSVMGLGEPAGAAFLGGVQPVA